MEGSPLISPSVSFASSRNLSIKERQYVEEDMEELIGSYKEMDFSFSNKIELVEYLDLSINITTYKIYEATHEFKVEINNIKEQRDKLLATLENRSELSLILNDLDKKVSDLQVELELNVANLNRQKIAFQEEIENTIPQLEEEFGKLKEVFQHIKSAIDVEHGVLYRPQIQLINEKYIPVLADLETEVEKYQQLQSTGWKLKNPEERLASLLEVQGLRFTPSGCLLTAAGSRISFAEAQHRGYFDDIREAIERIFSYIRDHTHQQPIIADFEVLTETTSSSRSTITSEEVRYLKAALGKPLTLALAEITAKQPRDPIHYLGHYLFKYRYNQELELIQKKEVDDLLKERRAVASERWHKFVEEEARAAVIDMVLRAEAIAMDNELRRIEADQLLMQEEEEEGDDLVDPNLIEEARDKFE